MKRVKISEVPMDYRRNYKKELVEFLKMSITCGLFIAIILYMVWMS